MTTRLILASASEIRATLLRNAGLTVEALPARIDEDAIRSAMQAEGAAPHDLAGTLAQMKAQKLSDKHPGALVLGCDQVLSLDRETLNKPADPDDALAQLAALSGKQHKLLSAVVAVQDGTPIWRHVGEARLTMHALSDSYRQDYVARNWNSIRLAVGCYKLEEEGVRLFSRIEGDYFTILGLPLLELLSWLALRGDIAR